MKLNGGMKLPQFAVVNHQFTLMILLLLVILGVVSMVTMPRSEDPQITLPISTIIAVYPGTAPLDMEQLVVDPIEDALYALDDVKKLKTTITDGVVTTQIEFHDIEDPDDYYDDVVQAMYQAREELPDDLLRLEVLKASPTNVNIFLAALTSEQASFRELRRIAERLELKFEKVSGVKQADVWGIPSQQIQVRADLEKMRQWDISLDTLLSALEAASVNIPAGHVDAGQARFTVRTSGDFKSLEAIQKTIVRGTEKHVVFVSDVAEVHFADDDPTHAITHNGKRSVIVSVKQRENTNIFNVQRGLIEILTTFQKTLPKTVKIDVVFDQTASVEQMLSLLQNNLLQGLLLVGLIVLAVIGLKQSLVIVLAIPCSMLVAIGWVDLNGFGLQQITIAGLVIALGLLVDNAIVITENITRLYRQGKTPLQAAIEGAGQMGWAVASGTITTVLAFIPMLMLEGGTGRFIRSLPVTVILTLLASLIIALTFTPWLSSKMLKKRTGSGASGNADQLVHGADQSSSSANDCSPESAETRIALWFSSFTHRCYVPFLRLSLQHPVWVLLSVVLILSSSLWLFPKVGVSLFPKAEKPQLMINIDTPEDTSFDTTGDIAHQVEQLLAQQDGVKSVTTNVGRGNPKVYYNVEPKREQPNHAQLFVQLSPDMQESLPDFVSSLRQQVVEIPGAEIAVKEFEQGPPLDAPVAIWVVGDHIPTLKKMANAVADIMRSTPGVINVRNPTGEYKTDLNVAINRDKAGLLGVPIVRIDKTIRTALSGSSVGTFRDELGDEYSIIARLADSNKPTLDDFERITVASVNGQSIPLRQVAQLNFTPGQASFHHYDLERTALVTADVARGFQVVNVTSAIVEQLQTVEWPTDFSFRVGGEEESREESFAGITKALLIALLGIFAVLVLQFKSFVQPVIVFAAIPLSIVGVLVCLFASGNSFSFMAFIGFSSLVGIVVNNSIILIDYANQLRASGLSVANAALEAGKTRLIPIVLTTFTTVGGLLPLTLSGSSLWAPLGWTIIGGLLSSTVLTIVVVPVLFKLLTAESKK
ncbi:efflux RND transporter permease subunit [Zooshikella ganghwensis]|uniref:efflux RND transporter permease subunit n=1 Tax=Zooshikella ganghwensis TaxID=202772 RepID=UPI00042A1E3A|nr:efflux RND transporter permease subunit [Zooshikella ganghwensis]